MISRTMAWLLVVALGWPCCALAIDGCLVGTWTATSFVDLTGRGTGGAGFYVTFAVDGTQTVDYSAMQPITYAGSRDTTLYSGSSAARIATKEKQAKVESIDRAAVFAKWSTLHANVPPQPLKGHLGPGALGGTRRDNGYVCEKDTLTYKTSAAVDLRPTHEVTLTRGRHAVPGKLATVSPPPTPPAPKPPPKPEPPPEPAPAPPPPTEPPATSPTAPPATAPAIRACPHRGKGCAALIVDFSKHTWTEPDFDDIGKDLVQSGCPTQYAAPNYKPVPQPYVIEVIDPQKASPGGGFFSGPKKKVLVQADPSAVAEANRHNDAEWKKVTDAAEAHRAVVRNGIEVAIELINGHGSNVDDGKGGTCGIVGAQAWGTDISRGKFHAANYAAVNNNACTWIVGDFSCTGGLTPRAIDELSNTGAAACLGRSRANSCDLHAAYKNNVSVSSATAEGLCTSSDKRAMRAQFAEMVQSFRTGRAGGSGTSWYAFRGYYSDSGKIDCGPHVRKGY